MTSNSLQVKSKSPSAEVSPEGHWSKNFAALSIHRRKDWAVTVKGFNRFVWDFDNDFFASHGSMLIANGEEALKAHDVQLKPFDLWDWSKIPGATTISKDDSFFREIPRARVKTRNFSPLSFAGGVSFKGREPLFNGVFGMDFHQPVYENRLFYNLEVFQPRHTKKLHFKKSVFFYQNFLVCLGSNIAIENGGETNAQTTLFQDKLVRRGTPLFSIKVDKRTNSTTLVDSKGNSYYIPESTASSLKVESKTADGPSSDIYTYAAAWLEHTFLKGAYEYAIWIKTISYSITSDQLWTLQRQENRLNPYQVLRQDDGAHVVKFGVRPKNGENRPCPLYGYVFFRSTTVPQGPIEAVNMHCRIMAEEDQRFVYLSISYPDLNFPLGKVLKSASDVKVRELFHVESNEMEIEVTLRRDVEKCLPNQPKVSRLTTDYVPRVRVESSPTSPPGAGNKLVFSNLKNGFSVEVKLKKRNTNVNYCDKHLVSA